MLGLAVLVVGDLAALRVGIPRNALAQVPGATQQLHLALALVCWRVPRNSGLLDIQQISVNFREATENDILHPISTRCNTVLLRQMKKGKAR